MKRIIAIWISLAFLLTACQAGQPDIISVPGSSQEVSLPEDSSEAQEQTAASESESSQLISTEIPVYNDKDGIHYIKDGWEIVYSESMEDLGLFTFDLYTPAKSRYCETYSAKVDDMSFIVYPGSFIHSFDIENKRFVCTDNRMTFQIDFDTGDYSTTHSGYTTDMLPEGVFSTSDDGRYEIYQTAFDGMGDSAWCDMVVLDTQTSDIHYLCQGYCIVTFGQGYKAVFANSHSYSVDTFQIFDISKKELLASHSFDVEGLVINSVVHDDVKDLFVFATTIAPEELGGDSPVTLYISDGHGNILYACPTQIMCKAFTKYNVNSIVVELDGKGNAILYDNERNPHTVFYWK